MPGRIKQVQELSISKVLEIVLRPLQINLGICGVILVAFIVSCLFGVDLNGVYETRNYELNTCAIPKSVYLVMALVVVALMIILFIVVNQLNIKPIPKFGMLIISTVVILFALIYLTGGILDSPFTGALGVYVTSYFIIQERNDLRKINSIIGKVVVVLTIVPYLVLPSDCGEYLIHWKTDFFTNCIRLVFTLLLIGIAGYWGDVVNKQLIKEFKLLNKLK